jgi:hypothetical protein
MDGAPVAKEFASMVCLSVSPSVSLFYGMCIAAIFNS